MWHIGVYSSGVGDGVRMEVCFRAIGYTRMT